MCGEKIEIFTKRTESVGSPPRVRGKGVGVDVEFRTRRITPACAGKSAGIFQAQLQAKDHPRVCGEKIEILMKRTESAGSPPRVRGKVPAADCKLLDDRITPACAGKSVLRSGADT